MIQTRFHCSDENLNDLWRWVVESALNDFGCQELDGRVVAMGPPWLRDHVHEMKAYKWLVEDMTSGLEFFFRHQLPDGQFPDFFVPVGDQHQSFVHPDFELEDPAENRVFIRVPVEADLEYLAVEGVYQAWQATGDTEWMSEQMPILERGLKHLTSHRWRWSEEYGLVKRPFTPDTWDFINWYDADDHFKTNCEIRRMDDSIPFCIFHGDNSGLYSASMMMADMRERACPHAQDWKVREDTHAPGSWIKFGEGIRERANRLLWGDGFYIHQFHLDPALAEEHNERLRLSLSNPYDINRGMPNPEMAVSIIDSYRERWKLRKDTHIAEWFTIDPPYEPRFSWYLPGEYVNGGIFGAVAGELSKAAFHHGREAYAVDILRRYHALTREWGEVRFMWWPDGRPFGGGPSGWCGAAVVSAMMEGLAGVKDRGVVMSDILLSPRWASADVTSADIVACYPASDKSFSCRYEADSERITIECSGEGSLSIHLMLPPGAQVMSVSWQNQPMERKISQMEDSSYVDVEGLSQSGVLVVDLRH